MVPTCCVRSHISRKIMPRRLEGRQHIGSVNQWRLVSKSIIDILIPVYDMSMIDQILFQSRPRFLDHDQSCVRIKLGSPCTTYPPRIHPLKSWGILRPTLESGEESAEMVAPTPGEAVSPRCHWTLLKHILLKDVDPYRNMLKSLEILRPHILIASACPCYWFLVLPLLQ